MDISMDEAKDLFGPVFFGQKGLQKIEKGLAKPADRDAFPVAARPVYDRIVITILQLQRAYVVFVVQQ